jgi:pilus assembly protein CpaB
VGAQKLSLAASVGTLSLMLRKAGEAQSQYSRRITLGDLSGPSTPVAKDRKNSAMATVAVRRAATREEYSVPIEGMNLAATGGDR